MLDRVIVQAQRKVVDFMGFNGIPPYRPPAALDLMPIIEVKENGAGAIRQIFGIHFTKSRLWQL